MDDQGLKPCVVPVAAADALAWCQGRLNDVDLLLRSPLVPEAVFVVNLPNRAGYREVLGQVKYWRTRGAVCLITRTGTAVVDRHMLKVGCVRTLLEHTEPPKYRLLAPPAAFSAWLAKWSSL
jgi:hypothetical protein